jgi:repressor LexA
MDDLSPRQRELLDLLANVIEQRGVPPTFREIGAALGIGSTNGVSEHIKALEKKGYIERIGVPGSPRSLRILPKAGRASDDAVVGVPIIGRIAAGNPLHAVEAYDGALKLDASLLPPGGDVFALVVTGDSMIEDGIHDGDYLFVRPKPDARNGEIAVAMVDGEATVKRIFREGRRVRLQPANAAMEPIYVDANSGDFRIVGVAVGVFRRIR